jgi:hypothetical protein
MGSGGADGIVFSLASESGNLYAGGGFSHVGGVSTSRIARWNGSAWSDVHGGANSFVFALAGFHGELHAGGSFSTVNTGVLSTPGWARYLETGAPWVFANPNSATVGCQADVTFTARPAAGYSPFLNWRHNGSLLTDGPTGTGSSISGSNETTLQISGVSGADGGTYDLVVTDPGGCGSGNSASATLTVISSLAPDLDGDCHVDASDVALMRTCMSRANVPPAPGCENRDLDGDNDVDLDDFAILQRCYSGSTQLPRADCAN